MTEQEWAFVIEVRPPNPEAPRLRERNTGLVIATFEGQEAGFVSYGTAPDGAYALTYSEVGISYRKHGCLTQMIQALKAEHPGAAIVDGGSTNSPEGDAALRALRAKKLVEGT